MNIASFIDHTALSAVTTKATIDTLCAEALTYHFAAVCVPPSYVKQALRCLKKSTVQVATVIGFPLGYHRQNVKLYELEDALAKGAQEIDMVAHLGAIKDKRWKYLEQEIGIMTKKTHRKNAIIKVIIETAILDTDEIKTMCKICAHSGVDFVKTSTGFNGGATVETVQLMRQILPPAIAIKASGGIRTRQDAEQLLAAGATRLGCSQGVAIMQEK